MQKPEEAYTSQPDCSSCRSSPERFVMSRNPAVGSLRRILKSRQALMSHAGSGAVRRDHTVVIIIVRVTTQALIS